MRSFRLLPWLVLLSVWMPVARAGVVRVEVETRAVVLGGRSFGAAGPYEVLTGRILFAFDPANPANARIVDLTRAPRNADGQVEAWANFVALKPVDPARGRPVALVEVSNRGGKFSPRYFNRAARASLDPDDPDAFGDALLMRLGLTVLWVGWQYDVPERPGVLRLHVPRAADFDGAPLTGLVRSDWTLDAPATTLALGHRNHRAYPVADVDDPANVLTVRDGREAPRHVVPRDRWRFAREEGGRIVPDSTHLYLAGGFEVGRIYELVYRAAHPAVVGLGLAALRDVIAYAKYAPESLFPVRYGIAAGVSQTGRFLRHFLYQGFNTDEHGRMAYDGMLVITAGAGRGSFNHRFAQPSRDAHRYSAFFYPTDLFPFTSATQRDGDRSDGLLAHLLRPDHAPKRFFVNTGYEYWGRAAALIHTTPDAAADVPPGPDERIYHLAGGQHFVWSFPPRAPMRLGAARAWRGNPLDYSGIYRALLVRLVDWVDGDVAPPPSAFPRLADGALVEPGALAFPAIPGVAVPHTVHTAYRADYGPRWAEGIIDVQPPHLGAAYPARVPQVDTLGNEVGGVRSVELTVPLATYAPWSLRQGLPGDTTELADFFGTFIPLPRTEAERARTGDPRPSLEALYAGRDDYLARVRAAVEALIAGGFLLPDDREHVVRRATAYWDWATGGS